MTPRVDVDELVTQADIARMLLVTRQRAVQLTARNGFPPAIGKVGRSTVWRRADVDAWAADWDRRGGRPKKEATTR